MMVSRLMFSLKKAVDEQAGPWTLSTMGDFGRERSPDDGTLRFVTQTFDGSHEISGALAPPSEGVVELDPVPQSLLDSGSRQPC